MATLDLTYSDVYNAVIAYLGSPSDTADVTRAKNIVKRGYRKFLMPVDMSTIVTTGRIRSAPKPYRWSFLRQTTTLATTSGTDTYDLPIGYNGMIIPLKHTTDETFNPMEVPLEVIYQKRSESTGDSYPLYFAVKEKDFDKIVGRRRELLFYPVPNQVFTYYYTYRLIPEAPVEDDDLFVGPVGSSEAILECSLAVAELQEKDGTAVVHKVAADELVQQLIGDDKLGSLVGNIGSEMRYGRPRRTSVISFESTQIIPA